MAIYYPSATDQRDGSSATATPFLQEQLYSNSYDELSIPSGNFMMYMNQSAPSSSYMEFMSEHSLSHQECVNISAVEGSREGLQLQNIPSDDNLFNNAEDESVRKIPRMQVNMVNSAGDQNVYNQGLSLSLSTDIQSGMVAPSQYQYSTTGHDSFSHLAMSAEGATSSNYLQFPTEYSGDYGHIFKQQVLYSPQLSMGTNHTQHEANVYNSFHTKTISDSKFLKAAQQLLDEVVNVQDALKKSEIEKTRNSHQTGIDKEVADKSSESANLGHSEASSSEMSPAARQELLNKKSKLISMLDEVDRRFSQYYHQMHAIVSSFDSIAGHGSAKPYTKLALQAISRHFRSLRDAIVTQIQATRKSLGEQDTSANLLGGGIPRLRYVDQQIRQQRGFHPLSVSRHSWRPQRGLPESSVTVLRAWLFEHFLHPYPKESEKVMLARQTGLTRGQVANWFINARVRLWKPMVEEMYKEEFGESDAISISSPDRSRSRSRSSTVLKTDNAWDSIDHAVMSSTGGLADFFQNRLNGDEDDELGFGLMKFEGDRRLDTSLLLHHHHHHHDGVYHSEVVSLNQDGDGSSLAQDNQVSLGLGVTRP